ncbi:MAG TPA: hypothetical protein VHG09_13090 [Longimicrobiales bacterium]|nr:hypothetical protein [Longimicrobiales bacterium]
MRRSLATIILAVALPACGSDRENADTSTPALAPRTDATLDVDSQRLPPRDESLPERPAARQDTIVVEGTPEVMDFALVRSPPGFLIPFSTYVPASMTVTMDTAGPTDVATFTSGEAREMMDEAFMTVGIYPAGTTLLQAEDSIREFVVSRGPGIDESRAVEPPSWGEWAVELSYPRSLDRWYAGSAVIGQYGPRYFHVLQLYPAEYGDGIRPRFQAVLEHWRWDDTGRMLESGGTSTR